MRGFYIPLIYRSFSLGAWRSSVLARFLRWDARGWLSKRWLL